MFSIFGTSGTVFKGPLEDLVRVRGVLPSTATRPTNAFIEHLNDAERRQLYTHWPQAQVTQQRVQEPPKNRLPAQAAFFTRRSVYPKEMGGMVGDTGLEPVYISVKSITY